MTKDKKVVIGINGFGRIGSVVLKAILTEKYDVEVGAINTTGEFDMDTFVMQFKYDSVYHRFPAKVDHIGPKKGGEIGRLIVGNKEIPFLGEMDPEKIKWKNYNIDVVLECTGAFASMKAMAHIKAGAKKVIISAPSKDGKVPVYILGVNDNKYKGENLISNGSCTTNCVAPIIKLIDQKIGFEEGVLTTIHAYTANQNLVDGSGKDARRARAAATNIVPTTTGAAEAVIAAYPEVEGRFGGTAIRVPVICGSYSDLTFKLIRKTTIEEVNSILAEASTTEELIGRLKVSYEPMVSSDILGNNASCVIDAMMTKVISDDMLTIGAWYDNEYGYSCRLIENAIFICK